MKSALIQNLLKNNIIASRRLGQNFLIDPNFLQYIIRAAEISGRDEVIEIGSGPGILTELIARAAHSVTAVEIDHRLFVLSRESTAHMHNVRFINASILDKTGNALNPTVTKHLTSNAGYKVVSNLPYKTAVPIIMSLLEAGLSGVLKIKSLLVMVQLEIAQRLAAPVGTAEYGAVSILAQHLADIRIDRKVPPEVFYPRPRVQSAMVSIVTRKNIEPELYRKLKRFVPAIFHYRRKTVRTALEKTGIYSKGNIEMLLFKSGIDGKSRPENLTLTDYIKLCSEAL